MKTFKILIYLAALILAACAIVFFGGQLGSNIIILNIIVLAIVLGLALFINYPSASFQLSKKTDDIGVIGVRWVLFGIYCCLAIGIMLVANIMSPIWSFQAQLLFQSAALLVLATAFYLVITAENRTKTITDTETYTREYLDEIRAKLTKMNLQTESISAIPQDIKQRIVKIADNFRYLSPSQSVEARQVEQKCLDTLHDLNSQLVGNVNIEKIEALLIICEQLYLERKTIYYT